MASVTDFFPPSPKLAHTRNLAGNFGMFVNPETCPCSGCGEYRAENEIPIIPPPPPSPPMLAHTRNLSGNFGMFVNPETCSCSGCDEYRGERVTIAPPPPTPTPISLTTRPPLLARSETMLSPPPDVPSLSQTRAADILSGLSRTATYFSRRAVDREEDEIGPTSSLAPAPTGGLGLFSGTHGAVRFWTPPVSTGIPVRFTQDQMSTLKSSLREFTELLTQQQNDLDHTGCRSHDEMAAQDVMWDDLDRKISEIDDILAVLEGATAE